MVDPNRKINRLTDKDVEFLEECEREFAMRYTEEDAEFMKHCSKPLDDPPIVENWNTNEFSGNRNQRNWRNNYRHRRGGRESFDDRSRSYNNPYSRPAFKQQETTKQPPRDIRSQYCNFVAASKDD